MESEPSTTGSIKHWTSSPKRIKAPPFWGSQSSQLSNSPKRIKPPPIHGSQSSNSPKRIKPPPIRGSEGSLSSNSPKRIKPSPIQMSQGSQSPSSPKRIKLPPIPGSQSLSPRRPLSPRRHKRIKLPRIDWGSQLSLQQHEIDSDVSVKNNKTRSSPYKLPLIKTSRLRKVKLKKLSITVSGPTELTTPRQVLSPRKQGKFSIM